MRELILFVLRGPSCTPQVC